MIDVRDVQAKLDRGNRILFNQNSDCLQPLIVRMNQTGRRHRVLWAFRLAEEIVCQLTLRYPADDRPRNGLNMATAWARGDIKMGQARQGILAVHRMAKEWTSPEDIALAHALGQGLSTVHVAAHAIGLPMYELSALVYRHGLPKAEPLIEVRLGHYEHVLDEVLLIDPDTLTWAKFLRKL